MYLPVHSVDVEGIRIPNQCPLPFLQNVVAFYLANKQVSERATLCSGNEVTHGHPDKYIYTHVFSSLPKTVIPSFTASMTINSNSYLLLKGNHCRARNASFQLRAVNQSTQPCPPGHLHLARQPSLFPKSLAEARHSCFPSKLTM